jgi:hypothetical protein
MFFRPHHIGNAPNLQIHIANTNNAFSKITLQMHQNG